jgi:hypothetical protein
VLQVIHTDAFLVQRSVAETTAVSLKMYISNNKYLQMDAAGRVELQRWNASARYLLRVPCTVPHVPLLLGGKFTNAGNKVRTTYMQ